MASRKLLSPWSFLLLWIFLHLSSSLIEEGYTDVDFAVSDVLNYNITFKKSMYKGSSIMFQISCDSKATAHFDLEIYFVTYNCPAAVTHSLESIPETSYLKKNLLCTKHIVVEDVLLLQPYKLELHTSQTSSKIDVQNELPTDSKPVESTNSDHPENGSSQTKQKRKKRDNTAGKPVQTAQDTDTTRSRGLDVGENKLAETPSKGLYEIYFKFTFLDSANVKVHIESKFRGSYLSAMNWPLLPFYGAMSLLYLAYGIGWFIASCCNWRDLLRVQFWIGGVIALGMFENALFYAEFSSISQNGKENGLLYFAEIVSSFKKTLARILVIIVSMGFGIVKPRLGETLHKVLAAGGLYFLLASAEGLIRVKDDEKLILNSKTHMYALVPLTILDVGLCWWIFTSLVQTTRTLRIRKNIVKLTLYRHFTNTLVFAVIASLAYLVWMIKEAKFTPCVDVTSIWLNDAIWPFVFAVILAVIMVLWRPSNNNQRYAFTPLDIGDSDDENDEMTLSEAFDGMKMRHKSESHSNGEVKNRNKAEDDLKWVEENIPSVPSTLLPTLDSEEELVMTKFETSKMD